MDLHSAFNSVYLQKQIASDQLSERLNPFFIWQLLR